MVTKPRGKPLTAAFIKAVSRPGRYGDGHGGHGLSLLVKPMVSSGRISKTWSQRIRIDGKHRTIGLGSYPTVTLAEARKRVLTNRQKVSAGHDPRASRAPKFRDATDKVIALHAPQWKPGGRTEEHWRSCLATYAFPKIGNKLVSEITSAHVMGCVAPLWHSKPEMARKVLRRISAIMEWSIVKNYRSDNPADRKRITAALGKNTNGMGNFKSLHHSKVAGALEKIDATGAWWATTAATRFLTLTATRSAETRLATWDEINFASARWTIPADRTKTGREFRVPLSTAALAVLAEAAGQTGGEGLIFPSRRGKPMSAEGLSKLFRENEVGCVPHGMRSSFRDWCGETGVPREVAEQALSHVVKGVEGAYARSDLLDRRRPLMEAWGCYVTRRL